MRPPRLPETLLAAAVLVLTGVGVVQTFLDEHHEETARLGMSAELKARQVGAWLAEREADAALLSTSRYFASLVQHWRVTGMERYLDMLRERFAQFRAADGFASFILLGSAGERLWGSEGASEPLAGPVRAAVARAAGDGEVVRVGPYRDELGAVRLDFLAPVTGEGAPRSLVVLQVDAASWLFPTLSSGSRPSESVETLLVRGQGEELLYITDPRWDPGAERRLPLAEPDLLAARAVRGETGERGAVEGVDYRGARVVGAARGVPGTDWVIITKVAHSAIHARAVAEAVPVALAGALGLVMVLVGARMLRQRHELDLARRVADAREERLQAMRLLAGIADSSDDCIFAKDLDGRYRFFNRGAERMTGKAASEVLGRDDGVLFPPEVARRVAEDDHRAMQGSAGLVLEERLPMAGGERVLLTTKGALRDGAERVIGTFGIARDITERKRVESALRTSEAFNRAILDSVSAHIAVLDGSGRIIAVNEAWRRFAVQNGGEDGTLAGGTEVGVNYLEVCDRSRGDRSEGAGEAAAGIRAVLGGRIPSFSLEYACHAPGRERWFTMTATPLGGSRAGAVVTHTQITERVQAEETLRRQTEEIRQRNAELERFNRASVGRELAMIGLKQEVNELSHRLGLEPPYSLDFLGEQSGWPEPTGEAQRT